MYGVKFGINFQIMSDKKYVASKSKTSKVRCHLCGKDSKLMLRQNLGKHMKDIHGDNSGNVREYGQQDIRALYFGGRKETSQSPNIEVVSTERVSSIGKNNDEDVIHSFFL